MKNILLGFLGLLLGIPLIVGYNLYTKNQILEKKIQKLSKEKELAYKLLQDEYDKLAKKFYELSQKKIDLAYKKAIPIVGVADIAQDTKDDISFYCNYLNDTFKLYQKISNQNLTKSAYAKKVCSIDTKKELKALIDKEDIKSYEKLKKDSLKTIEQLKKEYEKTKLDAQKMIQTLQKNYQEISNSKEFQETLEDLKKQYEYFSEAFNKCFSDENTSK
jgi:hypothetical protein